MSTHEAEHVAKWLKLSSTNDFPMSSEKISMAKFEFAKMRMQQQSFLMVGSRWPIILIFKSQFSNPLYSFLLVM